MTGTGRIRGAEDGNRRREGRKKMGFGTVFKANKAFRAQKNGNEQEAMQLYA